MSTTSNNQIDPIIEDIHEARRQIAERFGYDVHRISEDAKRRQMDAGRQVWQPKTTNEAMPSSGEVEELG